MCKLSCSFLLICVFSLIGVQNCYEIPKVELQDFFIVGAFLPVDKYQRVNYSAISLLAQNYKNNGIKVIIVAGFYGEGPSLPLPERKRVVKAWEEQCNLLGLDLIIEVGVLPFVDTLEMARYCSTLNVTAITAYPEVVYQASTITEQLEDLQRICDASGNKLPLLYHDLSLANENIGPVEVFKGAMGGCVSCFCGVVTNVNSFLDIKASVDSIEGYQFWGVRVDAIAATLKIGMNASLSINPFPDLARRIQEAVYNCNLEEAADIQQEVNRISYGVTNPYGGVIAAASRPYFENFKAAFELRSCIDVGYRYPLVRPNPTTIDKIRSNLQRYGVPLCNCTPTDTKNYE